MQEHSPSIYQKLAETDFHQKLHDVNPETDSMIIGDVGVDMLNHAADIDWQRGQVTLAHEHEPTVSHEGEPWQMDIMATSPDAATLAEYKETAKELLGDDVSVSVVGLHRYAQTWHDLLGLTGGYYQDGKGGVQYRTGMIKTPMPEESLRSWQVQDSRGAILGKVLNLPSQLSLLQHRFVSGVRSRDAVQYAQLHSLLKKEEQKGAVPDSYQAVVESFAEHQSKLDRARKRLGMVAIKSALLGVFEHHESISSFVQGDWKRAVSAMRQYRHQLHEKYTDNKDDHKEK